MANSFISVQEIARQALPRLIENLVFPNLVHKDFSNDFVSGKGATIQVKKPVILTAEDFNASTGTTAQDIQEQSVTVKLDKLATVDAEWGAIEGATSVDDLNRLFIEPAAAALAEKINRDGLALANRAIGHVTIDENTTGLSIFSQAAKVLNNAKVPMTDRYGVWCPDQNADFQVIPALVNAEKSGSTEALRAGAIGRVFGIDNYMSQGVQKHVCGTAVSTVLTLTQAPEKGKMEVKLKAAAACTLNAGDRLVINGNDYVVEKDVGVTTVSTVVTLNNPMLENLTTSAAVEVKGNGMQNVVFHKNAFAFVTRPLTAPAGVESYTTSYNGISLRVTRGYDMKYKKDMISMDVLYGYKTMYPEMACVVLG